MNKTRKRVKTTFATYFWNSLVKNNVCRVFGLPGGPMDYFLSMLPKTIEWTNTGNELQNGFCAQVYGHYTQNVGYLFTTTGPGFATTISALQQAIYEGNPLVSVSTVISSSTPGDFQSWPVQAVSKQLTQHYFYIGSLDDVHMVEQSYQVAKQLSTGVILLIENAVIEKWTHEVKRKPLALEHKLYRTIPFANYLVVIGKCNNYREIISFIHSHQLPYVTTWKCRCNIKGAFYCGRLGTLGQHSANYALRHATHLLLAGNVSSELQTPTKEKFSLMYTEHAKRIHFQEVESVTPNPTWLAKLQSIHHLQGDLPRLSLLERYAYIASSIYKQQKLTIPVCTDVGNHWYAIGKYMEMEEPLFESTTTWASIGTGMASSIGMYYALKRPIWCFMGDGGTLFGSSDLLYLLNHPHLPITVTLYINHIYGAIFEDVVVKQDAVNEIVSVPTISILKQLPNCHYFKKEEAYASYLSAHPSSNTLRFIVISLPKPDDSNVYQIQADAAYEQHILHDRFQEMLQTPLILY